jgi:hypothetical protein
MGQYITKKCECCRYKNATYQLSLKYNIPQCKCNKNINSFLKSLNISKLLYNYEKCNCERNEIYDKYIRNVYSDNRDILEFMTKIPLITSEVGETLGDKPVQGDNNEYTSGSLMYYIFFNFYGCDDCVNYRPWSKQKLNKI